MKRIYHEEQLGTKRRPLATNDMIVFGRNAHGDDVELARVGGHCGNRSHGRLYFEKLQDLPVRRVVGIGDNSGVTKWINQPEAAYVPAFTDWEEIMEQQESIAADNIAWTR